MNCTFYKKSLNSFYTQKTTFSLMMKPEIRIIGIDDGPFTKKDKKTIVVGVICRGGFCLDGLLRTYVDVDGMDATDKLIEMINNSRHKPQLKVIMIDGITLGGFNLVDIHKLNKKTDLPVVVINRKKPDLKAIKQALVKHFDDWDVRWKIIKKTGKVKKIKINQKFTVYYQFAGLSEEEVQEIILISTTRAQIPEPVRIAHIIASGIIKGESEGGA